MKDYKSFIGEAAGEGFGETPEGYKRAQQATRALKDMNKNKQQEQPRKPTPASGATPDGPGNVTPGPGGAEFRRRQREKQRDVRLDAIKKQRNDKIMSRAGKAYNTVKSAINPNSQAVGAAGGSSSAERGVRYQ